MSRLALAAALLALFSVAHVAEGARYTAKKCTYIVRPGDTLRFIAATYGATVEGLQRSNPAIKNPNFIVAGQQIVIPCNKPANCKYTVRPGDTMAAIAIGYRISLGRLVALNPQVPNPNKIYPGLKLTVPCR